MMVALFVYGHGVEVLFVCSNGDTFYGRFARPSYIHAKKP